MHREPRPVALEQAASGVALPAWIQTWVRLSENALTIPGTRFTVGLDVIVGLIAPSIGDWLSALGSLAMIWVAARYNVPQSVLLRMLFNVMLDTTLGAIPLLGDTFDLFFRSNTKNLDLLRAHAQPPLSCREGSRRLVVTIAVLLGAAVLLLWIAVAALAGLLLFGGLAWFRE